jgi:hypothetical protein
LPCTGAANVAVAASRKAAIAIRPERFCNIEGVLFRLFDYHTS